MSELAKELGVVPAGELLREAGHAHFNSLAMIDADGRVLGVYRKSHIPDGPGYQEKYYFTPGDTGFKVWNTKFGAMGAGICWDQWFPESARTMTLMGAEVLFYPTAIGSEPPPAPPVDSRDHWRRTMQGHAAANMTPLVASNRFGTEKSCAEGSESEMTFYGSSFIADETGGLVAEMAAPKRVSSRHRSISTPSLARAHPGACSATAGRNFTASSAGTTGANTQCGVCPICLRTVGAWMTVTNDMEKRHKPFGCLIRIGRKLFSQATSRN